MPIRPRRGLTGGAAGIVAVAGLALLLAGLPVRAQNQPSAADQGPVAIDGFAYRYFADTGVHMNVCEAAACGPGSRVSYVIYRPVPEPDFEQFKQAQEMVVVRMRESLADGVNLTVDAPTQRRDALSTMFESYREMRAADGRVVVTKSMQVSNETVTLSVISSARDRALADNNSALFLVGLMAWSGSLKP